MRNIKLVLAYDGTAYAGWQRQKDQPTIQGVIERQLAVLTGEKTVLHGAGRTDAGVHALGMTANFSTCRTIPVAAFRKGLNSLLPADILVRSAEEAELSFHARKNAVAKTYQYTIITSPLLLPTDRLYAAHFPGPLDLAAVRACLELITGEHDFSSFEASGSRDPKLSHGRGAVRKIFHATLEQSDPECLRLTFSGDGFLRHMVRNIVGTLIEVGRKKITVQDFAMIMKTRDRAAAGPTAPAAGLILTDVFY